MFIHRIGRQVWPASNAVYYNINVLVCKSSYESFRRPLRDSSDKYLKRVGKKGGLIVGAIMKIPGVTEVSIRPYQIRVEVAEMFNLAKSMEKFEVALLEILIPESGRENFKFEHRSN